MSMSWSRSLASQAESSREMRPTSILFELRKLRDGAVSLERCTRGLSSYEPDDIVFLLLLRRRRLLAGRTLLDRRLDTVEGDGVARLELDECGSAGESKSLDEHVCSARLSVRAMARKREGRQRTSKVARVPVHVALLSGAPVLTASEMTRGTGDGLAARLVVVRLEDEWLLRLVVVVVVGRKEAGALCGWLWRVRLFSEQPCAHLGALA